MERPSGTVTFLFTDIEGSTRMWEARPDLMAIALDRHDVIVRDACVAHGGFIFSTGGDGFAVAFARAASALDAAVAAQRELHAEEWPEGCAVGVRMGVHTGEAVERDGDYFGPPVNRAARLMGSALAGEVVASEATALIVRGAIGFELVDLGHRRMRSVAEPMRVFGVHAVGMAPIEKRPPPAAPGNLPVELTDFVGSLAGWRQGFADLPSRRSVTLTGPGGVGKTRAAIELAWLFVDEYPDGAWLAELGPVVDAAAVLPVVGLTLGVRQQPGESMLESIVSSQRERRLLIVLDNCEHVLDATRQLVVAINASCPGVTVLATSREPLAVPAERVHVVAPLGSVEGSELFQSRAVATDSSFQPTEDDLAAIKGICAQLDGIPLAIELAAARIRSLGPADLLRRLNDRFRLLRGARTSVERHQTLRAMVSWSYQLLSIEERLVFDRASVFAGSFDLAAAEYVCAGGDVDPLDVVDLLASLVDKSMICASRAHGSALFVVLETLRQYGEECLAEAGCAPSIRNRHLEWFLQSAQRANLLTQGPREAEGKRLFEEIWDNLRVAFGWAQAIGDVESAQLITDYAFRYGTESMHPEHRDWCDQIVALGGDSGPNSSQAFGNAAGWAVLTGDLATADALARRGIAAAEGLDDVVPDSRCWTSLGMTELSFGRVDATVRQRIQRIADEHPDAGRRIGAYYVLIEMAALQADHRAAATLVQALWDDAESNGSPSLRSIAALQRSYLATHATPPDFVQAARWGDVGLALAREVGSRNYEAGAYLALGVSNARLADPRTLDVARANLLINARSRGWWGIWRCFDILTFYWAANGERERAAVLLGHLQAQSAPPGSIEYVNLRRDATDLLGSDSQTQASLDRGAAMTPDKILAYALEQLGASPETHRHG